jgi:very-short-patch-repair endonuclease
LPDAELNGRVNGREVDAFFRAEGVIVELDGFEFHSSWTAFERDRRQDADALAVGLVTVRITWDRLIHSSADEAQRLHAILRRRRGERGAA